jgi:hypothetical protein
MNDNSVGTGRGDKKPYTLFGIPIIYQEVMGMPDMPKDNIPDSVLKKVAGTSKCAEDPPQKDRCEEEED